MTLPLHLPKELLELVFKELNRQDLVSCSYTSWFWNDNANVFLYHELSGLALDRLKKLVRTLAPTQLQNGPDTSETTARQRKLGNLVKVIKLREIEDGAYLISKSTAAYLEESAKLGLLTPNVHTAEIYDVEVDNSKTLSSSPLQWDLRKSKWQYLKRLKIIDSGAHLHGDIGAGFVDILPQIKHLDVLDAEQILECNFPPMPTTLNLISLKVSVSDHFQYDQVMTMLQSCRSTLQSLTIKWLPSSAIRQPLSLENIIQMHPNLKALALTYHESSYLTIKSFGDQLEVLEVIGNRQGNEQLEVEVGEAMMRTSNLKVLSLGTCSYFTEYIPTIIDHNRKSLQGLYITSDVGDELIDLLLADNIQADRVTTLCFECRYLDNSMIYSLSEIFPSVEYLGLARGKAKSDRKWISTQSLSRFRHLKGIDIWTFRELVDPNSYRGSRYKIRRPLILTSSSCGDYSM